jgi:regulator of protease activity HflC (stomatin/prohibitin superfamily)
MSYKGFVSLVTTFFIVFVVTVGMLLFTERVPEGRVAVVYTPSGGATKILDPGWHVIGLFEKTQEYPTRIQVVKDDITVATNDGKKITMSARYEYKVDKNKVLKIFKELGSQNIEEIQDNYLYTKLFKASREVVASYSLLDIYGTKTTDASLEITKDFAKLVEPLGFIVSDVTLGTPEPDKQTQAAIDARVLAAQQNELKKQELENEKIEAEKKRVIAEGEAQKQLIQARAQAEANKIISQSITPELLKKMEMEARLKHGWVTIQGGQPLVQSQQ